MPMNITKLNRQNLDVLGKELKASSQANELLRKEKEQEFIESLRQIEMQYDPEAITKMSEDEPKMYPGYTKSKTTPLKAKLCQYLFPEKELNWNIKPTVVPSISQKTLDYVIENLCQIMKTTPDQLTVEIIDMAVKELTDERCQNMKRVMIDQLTEDKLTEVEREALYSGIDYGTGVIKGALSKPYSSTKIIKTTIPAEVTPNNKILSSSQKETVKWEQKTNDSYRPSAECVRIWNFLPDLSATVINKCRFVDILRRETKHDIKALAKREDFFGEIITDFLSKYPKGNYKLRDWEITTLTTGTHNVDNASITNLIGTSSVSYTNQSSATTEDYEIIERDCYLDGWQLYEMGITKVEDVNAEYFCNIWLLGDKIIKIAQWPEKLYSSLDELYHIFYYDKNETSIFGKGLPKIVRYAQLGLAACDRHMLKNASWIAGPCGEVNVRGMHATQLKDANKVYPGKFFVKDVGGNDANIKTLSFYSVDARTTELLAIKNDLRSQGDSDSSLPSYLFGDNTKIAEGTPLGTSKMIFNSMVDFIKNLVSSFDKMHKSYLNSVYKWNMLFNPDENIKGDMQFETIGSAAAIINEAIVSQWAFLVQSLPDEAKDRIDWDEFLRMVGKYSNLPEYEKIVLSVEKYQKKIAQREQDQERQLAIQEALAQAKATKDTKLAEKTEAATAKIVAEIPHHVQSKQIENEGKVADIEAKKIGSAEGMVRIAKELMGKREENVATTQ